MIWLSRFARTRKWLYLLSVAVYSAIALLYLLPAAFLSGAVEPVWLPLSLRDIVGFVVPGLPANLVDLVMKHPFHALLLLLAAVGMRLLSRRVKVEEAEYAFRAWQLGSPALTPTPVPAILRGSWCQVVAVLLFLTVLFLGFLSGSGKTATGKNVEYGSTGLETSCKEICHPHLLAPGKTATALVVANRERNETGLLLKKDAIYTGRFVHYEGWRDGYYCATPEGVRFRPFLRFLARWFEWLRPYPEGAWFQVVGRIERGREVFPVLDTRDASCPFKFNAPRDGELVLLVNDVWYSNNSGVMTVELHRASEREGRDVTNPCLSREG